MYTQALTKAETKKIETPCDKYGDVVALNMTTIHYWVATILGWSFFFIGLPVSIGITLSTGNVLYLFGFWFASAILAMIASFMTLFVLIAKEASNKIREFK